MVITLEQVLKAYDYANSHPHKYLRGTTNWCAAVAHSLNAEQPAPVAYDEEKERANFDLEMRGTNADALLDQKDGHYINRNIRLMLVGWLLRGRYSPAEDLPAPVAVVMPEHLNACCDPGCPYRGEPKCCRELADARNGVKP